MVGPKKPLRIPEQSSRTIQRADVAPTGGYAMVVDGHFKTQFSEPTEAKVPATQLLANFPMLKIEIYNAATKTRTLVS